MTFLAGAEIDAKVIRRHFGSTMTIGAVDFFAPHLGILAWAHFISGWPWSQAQIAGIALSTTSVAVVYAVMVETGFNSTEIGKIILAACFINDIGTVLALGLCVRQLQFLAARVCHGDGDLTVAVAPHHTLVLCQAGSRVSEPQIKFVLVILFLLGGLANTAKSEAVLPAYLVGMVLAPVFLGDRELIHRTRVIVFTRADPVLLFEGGIAGVRRRYRRCERSHRDLSRRLNGYQFVRILPLTRYFRFERKEGVYTTLMMSTSLTFGSISALFGLTNHLIDERQYTILLTAVIGSAVVPTLIAQRWFQPDFKPLAAGTPAPASGTGEERQHDAKILVANDGSSGGLKALTAAIELGRQISAELHMVTVEELPRIPAS